MISFPRPRAARPIALLLGAGAVAVFAVAPASAAPAGHQGPKTADCSGLINIDPDGVLRGQPFDASIGMDDSNADSSVTVSVNGITVGSGNLDDSGNLLFQATMPYSVPLGDDTIKAVAYNTGCAITADVDVLAATSMSFAVDPATPLAGQPTTLRFFVSGDEGATTEGAHIDVELDGLPVGGSPAISGGVAEVSIPHGLAAGTHHIDAQFYGDYSTTGASYLSVDFAVVKAPSTLALTLAKRSIVRGDSLHGAVAVAGAHSGTVTVHSALGTQRLSIGHAGRAHFVIPAGLSVGVHHVTAHYLGTATVAASKKVSETVTVRKPAHH